MMTQRTGDSLQQTTPVLIRAKIIGELVKFQGSWVLEPTRDEKRG